MLTFRDTDKTFELLGDLLKKNISKNYNVYVVNLSDKKIMYEFAKENCFDERDWVKNAVRINLLKDYFNHLLSLQDLSKNQIKDGCHLFLAICVID